MWRRVTWVVGVVLLAVVMGLALLHVQTKEENSPSAALLSSTPATSLSSPNVATSKPSVSHDCASTMSFLEIITAGGCGNQRECIINGILLAHATGLGIVKPKVFPLRHAFQEFGKRGRTDYTGIYKEREKWNDFSFMFSTEGWNASLAKLGICWVESAPSGLVKVDLWKQMASLRDEDFSGGEVEGATREFKGKSSRDLQPVLHKWFPKASTPTLYSIASCYWFMVSRGENEACQALAGGSARNGSDRCHAATSAVSANPTVIKAAQHLTKLLRSKQPKV